MRAELRCNDDLVRKNQNLSATIVWASSITWFFSKLFFPRREISLRTRSDWFNIRVFQQHANLHQMKLNGPAITSSSNQNYSRHPHQKIESKRGRAFEKGNWCEGEREEERIKVDIRKWSTIVLKPIPKGLRNILICIQSLAFEIGDVRKTRYRAWKGRRLAERHPLPSCWMRFTWGDRCSVSVHSDGTEGLGSGNSTNQLRSVTVQ